MHAFAPTRARRALLLARWPLAALTVAVLIVGSASEAFADNQWPATVVAGAATVAGPAEWTVQANGVVTASSPRRFHGGALRLPLAQPITGMAATTTANGYWLVAPDGGVFSYGDAHFYGSMAATHLNQPVVGIASTKDGRGYWLAAADGGIFTFGDAPYLGSLGDQPLDQPIVGISATGSGKGYRLVARDGGVFTFGDATYRGSLGGQGITDVVGFSPTPSGNGYWILRKGGGTYSCAVQYGGCPDRSSTSVAGPSVENFGDARRLPEPAFVSVASGRPVYDYDFSGNPVVAIVANPLAQGYFILRSSPGTFGVAGAILTP